MPPMRIFKDYFMLLAALTMLLFFAGASLAAANSMQLNRVIAVVNGELITMYDLQQEAMPEISRRGLTGADSYTARERDKVFNEALENMILDILYKQEAQRYMIQVDDAQVENEVRRLIQSNNVSAEEFERQLALQGMTLNELKGKIRDSLLRQHILGALVARKAEVSQADIEAYYKENYSKYSTPSGVEFSVIMLDSGSRAQAVYDEIAAGKISFAEAAKKYSNSPTAALGGRMGNIPWKDLNPAWRQAMQGLKAGETTKPVSAGDTAVLLHVNALHEGSAQSLDAVAPEIEETLRQARLRERFEEFSTQLRAKAVVEIKI